MAIGLKNNPISNYFRTAWQELSRVVWPTRQQTIRHTILVIAMSLGFAIFFGAIDFLFSYLLGIFITKL